MHIFYVVFFPYHSYIMQLLGAKSCFAATYTMPLKFSKSTSYLVSRRIIWLSVVLPIFFIDLWARSFSIFYFENLFWSFNNFNITVKIALCYTLKILYKIKLPCFATINITSYPFIK